MTMGLSFSSGDLAIMAKPASAPRNSLAMPSRTCSSTNDGEPFAWNDRKSVGVPILPVA